MKIEILDNKVADLKFEIEDIRKTNHDHLETERKTYSDKFINLNNTLADMVVRLSIVENNRIDKETNTKETPKEAEMDRTKVKISKRPMQFQIRQGNHPHQTYQHQACTKCGRK